MSLSFFWGLVACSTLVVGMILGWVARGRRPSKSPTGPRGLANAPEIRRSSQSRSANPDYAASIVALRDPDRTGLVTTTVSAASKQGTAHINSGLPRQDNYCVLTKESEVVIVLCDGVSSATEAHLGSLFLVQNFERYYDEVFPDGYSIDLAKWKELNLKLSQNLVAMHISKSKHKGATLPTDLVELRLAAARNYASTLEVLVFKNPYAGSSIQYTYVRISGDGDAFLVRDDIVRAFNDGRDESLKDSAVSPLPVTDKDPYIAQGAIEPGQSLMICTDGISDFISGNADWRAQLVSFCKSQNPKDEDLLQLVAFPDSNARDDRTLVTIRNH